MKRINPVAINALKEALSSVYWYKRDLRGFLIHTLDHPDIVGRVNWSDYKRNIVEQLIEHLARNQDRYLNDLLNLIIAVTAIQEFSHLERLDDGQAKAERARKAVAALRELSQSYREMLEAKLEREKRREEYIRGSNARTAFTSALGSLYKKYQRLVSIDNPQKHGYELENLLRELFELFDLDPKASFKLRGEQIDGAFTFEGVDYLLEAKWQKERVGSKELDALSSKVKRKLDNTLGLFIAINGFSKEAIELHSQSRPVLLLMDGEDLVAVLEGRIDFQDLLRRKRRYAAQTGRIYISFWKM
ncbi:MAG: hypothetical protein D6791_17965 [Chloroflexi bacterium]|nr:MAG: hypothetical protein D6791_17965 [Chloroflexota bacterium]